jgi:hypothetical protein
MRSGCRRNLSARARARRPRSDRNSRERSFAFRNSCLNIAGLAADEPRKKQRLIGSRIERALHDRLSGRGTDRRGKACACQLREALLGLQERFRVLRIEIVPGISSAIHHDLSGHRNSPLLGILILRAVSANAQTQQRVRGKLTVSKPAYRSSSGERIRLDPGRRRSIFREWPRRRRH